MGSDARSSTVALAVSVERVPPKSTFFKISIRVIVAQFKKLPCHFPVHSLFEPLAKPDGLYTFSESL